MRVYLSSTYGDLKDHRRAVVDELHRAGYEVRAMEYYPAADDEPKNFSIKDVATCDVYVGIFADRYGYVPRGEQLSITEQEHNEAVRCLIPRLIFFVRPDHRWPDRFVDTGESAAKLKALKDKLGEQRTRLEFTTPEDLAAKVLASLQALTPGKRPLQHVGKRAIPFTGRKAELERLTALIRPKLGEGAAVGIWGLRGEAGIGKTALAAELAERLADQFPGGVLWTNLLEEKPAYAAVGWLRAYGENTADLKPDENPQECLDRFFAVARRRRPLIVLDNAWDKDRVAALLANNPGVVYMITTREQQHLPSGVQAERIVPMSTAEALDLLGHFAGRAVHAEPEAARQVCEQCGHLPVFLRVAGAAVQSDEFRTFAAYSRELAARGLASIAEFDQNAAAIFELSWQRRTPQEREALLALALFPGGDCGANYLQIWLKVDAALARRILVRLSNFSLLEPAAGERFGMHDRKREFLLAKLGDHRAELMRRTLECWTDWEFVECEFREVGIDRLVEEYVNLDKTTVAKPSAFIEWLHFIRGRTHVLAEHPDLFFQEAFNQPKEGVLSSTAQARAANGNCPESWLEWLNRAKEFTPPACLQVLTGHTQCVRGVALVDNGRQAISGSDDGTVRVWDLATGTCTAVLAGHTSGVSSVAVDAAGRRALSAGYPDNTVQVWDLATGTCIAVLAGHTGWVTSVAVDAAGQRAVSGSKDNTVRVWDLSTGTCTAVLEGHTGAVRGVALDAAGQRAVSGSEDNTVRVWDLSAGTCTAVLEGHTNSVTSVAVDAAGRRAVSGSYDNTVRVWDVATGICTAVLQGHTDSVYSVALDAGGRRAVSGPDERTMRVWDPATGTCTAVLEGHTNAVFSVAVDAAGRRAVSGSYDNTVRVWDLAAGSATGDMERHTRTVNRVVVDSAGHRAISESFDRTVRVWDLATGRCTATYPRDTEEARQARAQFPVRQHADGRRIKPARYAVTLHQVGQDEPIACAPGQFSAAACSPDGRRLVAGDGAGRVYIYRLRQRGEPLDD
jgi:WD40 repeat protein